MEQDVVMVLTSKSLPTMFEEGGSGDWAANEDRIRRCRWIIAVRNRHSDWSQGEEDHATAFLIGRICGVKPSRELEGRIVILFDKYAELNMPDAWPHQRNPVAYSTLEEFGIDPEKLDWKNFPKLDAPTQVVAPADVFEKAKQMIAQSLSIKPSAVRISIEV